MLKKRLRIGLDCDDVLYHCIDYACKLANQERGMNLTTNEFSVWDVCNDRTAVAYEYFRKASFWEKEPLMEGAVEFVKELGKRAEVFIVSAIEPAFMGLRAQRILTDFPEIPVDNILLGGRKDVIQLDVQWDDAPHNFFDSPAAFPVLRRQPWNHHISGGLCINEYTTFLSFVDWLNHPFVLDKGKELICLIGPTGSGKNAVAKELEKEGIKLIPSYTTRSNEKHSLAPEVFFKEEAHFLESSYYAGNGYGIYEGQISQKQGVLVMDAGGAISLRAKLPNRVVIVYLACDRRLCVENVLSSNFSREETITRLLSMDSEKRNREISDFVMEYKGSAKETASQILLALK